ncbi:MULTISPECIES: ATP-binding protein [Actinomycetes]|uniref:sensor histidine kinase n=1 Tax=Actinomycetes TaxID=1760 RepID=UPI0004BEF3E8|nr:MULTISPECIES: ATP-binding protein [Actinomycetes]
MATHTAPKTSLTVNTSLDDHSAGHRILRQFSVFISGGYLLYLALTAPVIGQSFAVMDLWWSALALPAVFGSGLLLGAIAIGGSASQLRHGAAGAALAYGAAVALWPLGWNGGLIDSEQGMWFSQFNGLAALAAVAAWRPRWAFAYLLAAVVSVQLINSAVRSKDFSGPVLPEVAWSFAFCIVPFAAGVMGIRTATILDNTRHSAISTAAEAAASAARAAERIRFDALTHDGVMSTLLGAARDGLSPTLSRQAALTLADMDSLAKDAPDRTVPADDVVAQIRNAVGLIDRALRMTVDDTSDRQSRYPLDVAITLAAAAAEAVRNSGRHAGPEATCHMRVEVADDRVTVEIADDGAGFDPSAVPPDRLGVAVSILGRLSHLTGGSARVDSQPGMGTRITLRWDRPYE